MSHDISEAIASVQQSLDCFKTQHKQKIQQVNSNLEATKQRLDTLEIMLKRPMLPLNESGIRESEFETFLRKGGDQSLSLKALHSSDGSTGGFLIPTAAMEIIQQRVRELSPLRTLANVTNINTDALDLLLEKSEADVGWVAETAERPETTPPELAKIKIPVHQIFAKPRVSQKLLDDSMVALENWIAEKISQKMAKVENLAFFYGDGNGKPRGLLTHERTKFGQGEWGKIETIKTGVDQGIDGPDTLVDTYYALKSDYLSRACWIMPRLVAAKIRKMRDKATGGLIWQQNLTVGAPDALLGHPVYLSDDMISPNEKAPFTIAFGDFKSAYQIVDRADIHILRDPFSSKPYVEFYATKRVGGDVVNFEAVKLITLSE